MDKQITVEDIRDDQVNYEELLHVSDMIVDAFDPQVVQIPVNVKVNLLDNSDVSSLSAAISRKLFDIYTKALEKM